LIFFNLPTNYTNEKVCRQTDNQNKGVQVTLLFTGVPAELAKLASAAKPTITFAVNGDTWSLKTETPFKTHVTEFKIGHEFQEKTADDRTMTVCRPKL